jgi:hypothetical protein
LSQAVSSVLFSFGSLLNGCLFTQQGNLGQADKAKVAPAQLADDAKVFVE